MGQSMDEICIDMQKRMMCNMGRIQYRPPSKKYLPKRHLELLVDKI